MAIATLEKTEDGRACQAVGHVCYPERKKEIFRYENTAGQNCENQGQSHPSSPRAEADARVRYAEDAIAGRYQDLFSHVIKTWEGR